MRAASAWLLAVSTGSILAQESGVKLQPATVQLGTLNVGAVCEASFGVWWTDLEKQPNPETALPDGFRGLGERTYPYQEDTIVTELRFAVPTDEEGEFRREITVVRGDERGTAEVRWVVERTPPGGSRILVAESPFEMYSTDDSAMFDAWRALVARSRLDVDYRLRRKNESPFGPEHLARVDIVLLGESSLTRLTDGDVARLQGFVCGGGRVVLCADAFFRETVAGANRICEPFGLTMVDRESFGLGAVTFDQLADHPLVVGVETVVVRRPVPTRIEEGRGRALVDSEAGPFVAYARTRSGGEVVTIGESLWWKWLGEAPGNARLLRNLLVRPPRMR